MRLPVKQDKIAWDRARGTGDAKIAQPATD